MKQKHTRKKIGSQVQPFLGQLRLPVLLRYCLNLLPLRFSLGKFAGESIPEPHQLDADEYVAKRGATG